jgi:hypothetical protein
VLDTASPHGIAWRSGIDRLITDITPELAGDLDCNGFDLTSVGNIGFSAVTGTLAGIENQNLLDKTAAESIAGIYTHNADIVMADNSITGLDTLEFTDTSGTIATIQNQNLLDKSAVETVAGAWTFGAALTVATPASASHAVTKTYADALVLDRAYWFGNKVVASHTLTGMARGSKQWSALQTGWTANEAANWVEVGGGSPTGEFEYSGTFPASGVRKFLVTWAFQMYGYSTVLWWNMLGRVTKDTGSGHVLVPGSEMASTPYAWYAVFGVNIDQHHVSGSCVVSIASGDKIAFQFGNFVSGAGTVNLVNLQTNLDATGLQLTITPVDDTP